ncbi:MAG: NADH-quinone oxidoreductase subunit A [Acidimicrobiaceae bacterium]|nr:NADH-quinone oxidoreductase subunit A [Acidimicrobiaceae bacterium]
MLATVLGQYLPVLALLTLVILFAVGSLLASRILAPRKPSIPKSAPYECGIKPAQDTPDHFPVKFFLVGMAFIVFDVEIILFYPYAVAHGGLGIFGLMVILVFTFAVFESFLYLISEGALNWAPQLKPETTVKSSHDKAGRHTTHGPEAVQMATGQKPETMHSVDTTSHTAPTARKTVRRVGFEGRR